MMTFDDSGFGTKVRFSTPKHLFEIFESIDIFKRTKEQLRWLGFVVRRNEITPDSVKVEEKGD